MVDGDEVGGEIRGGIFRKKREMNVGGLMNGGSKVYEVFGGVVEKVGGGRGDREGGVKGVILEWVYEG